MAETDNLGVEGNAPIPSLNDLQSQQIGGLVSPFSIDPSSLQLPEPPRSYPVGVPSSNLIKTQPPTDGYDQKFNKIIEKFDDIKWADDTLKYSKEESYNADYDGANFERYYKVGNVFKDKGFSPYKDNEKIYDENATWFDYYKRSLGAMGSGFVNGFTDMLPWNSWSSDVTDVDAARNMERAHAIGHDNRGGFGSFMNNMTVDFGYTAGILGEFAAEEIAMWTGAALTGLETGGTSLVAAGAETTLQAGKLGKLLKKAMDLKTYAKGLDKTYDWIRNADKLRDIYSVAKTGATKLGKGLVDAVVPETFKYADEMMQLGKKGDLVFDMAKTAKGFGALYRDTRRVSASVSESAMEGGSAELEVRNKLADEIYATGRAPSQEEWADIYAKAADAGKETFWWNLPALYASNAIVFDKAFKGFKPLEAFREELSAGLKGKLTYNQAWKAAGKKAWDVVDEGFMDSAKSLFKASTYKPKNLTANMLSKFVNYTQANLAEGFQEVYQDAVQKTMTDYYTDQFHHPALSGARSTWGAFADNAGMLNPFGESSQTFLSGFLMGSMATIPQKVAFEWIPKKFSQYTDPAGYAQYQDNLKRHTNSVVDALNAATMDEKFFDQISTNTSTQFNLKNEAEQANMAGDKKAFYTITDESVGKHLHTLISTGKINLIKDQLKDMKQLTPAELQEAFGPIDKSQGDPETFYQNKIDGMMNKIDLIEKHTERINKRFPNPFDPASVSKKKDPEGWGIVNASYVGFEKAKEAAIMSSYNFDRTVERIQSISNKLLKDYDTLFTGPNMKFTQGMSNANASSLGTILNVKNMDSTINVLRGEVETYSKGDAESQKKAEASKQELEDLENLINSITELQLTSFNSKKEAVDPNAKEVAEAKNAGKIKAGTKVKNKKGETVNVAKVKGGFAYDKAGNKIGKTKNLEIVGGEIETDNYLDVASKNLYEAYSNYIKNTAKRAGLTVHQNAIDATFQEYKDIFLLGTDLQEYADHVDVLHNPKKLLEFASRMTQVLQTINEQKRELLEKSYKKFLDSLTLNDLFGELYKMGIFLDEEGMQDILDKKLPKNFYKISDKSTIEEGDPKIDEIDKLLDQYEGTQGFVLEGRKKAEPETPETTTTTVAPVVKVEPEVETGALTKDTSVERLRTVGLLPSLVSAFREFVNSAYDTNNLEALYALNPKFADITKEKFNEFTDDQLAGLNSFKKYLGFTKPGRILAEYNRKNGFTTLEKESEAPESTGIPLTITSQIRQQLYDLGYNKQDVDAMKPEDAKKIIDDQVTKSKAPVTPSTGFVPKEVEARLDLVSKFGMDQAAVDKMTTPQVLAEYEAKLKSVKSTTPTEEEAERIDQFNRAKKGALERIKKTNNPQVIFTEINRLQEALKNTKGSELTPEEQTFINEKLKELKDKGYTFIARKGTVVREGDVIESKDSTFLELNEIKDSENKLIQEELNRRKKLKQKLIDNGLTEEEAIIQAELHPDDNIAIVSKDVEVTLLKDGVLEKVGKVTTRYTDIKNAELAALEGKPTEKVIEEPQEKQKEKITREQKDDLKALNFQPRDFATLSRKEAQDIIDEGLKKEDRLEREEQRAIDEALKAEAEKEESAKEKENRIKQMIEAAEYLEDFKDIDAEITAAIASDPFFNTAELENLIAQKKVTLSENPIFEDIKVNEIIQLNNKGKVIVLKKTAKTIQVRKASDITAKTFTINIKQFDKDTRDTKKPYVTMRIEPGSEIVSTETVVSTEDAETITENFKNATSATDEEELREDINLGKKLSAAERRNNIINNIKSCGL